VRAFLNAHRNGARLHRYVESRWLSVSSAGQGQALPVHVSYVDSRGLSVSGVSGVTDTFESKRITVSSVSSVSGVAADLWLTRRLAD
jgi:hypothetical protein